MKAQTIDEFIKEHGISRSQLASAVGISKQQINQFETSRYIIIDGKRFASTRKHEIDTDALNTMKANNEKARVEKEEKQK